MTFLELDSYFMSLNPPRARSSRSRLASQMELFSDLLGKQVTW